MSENYTEEFEKTLTFFTEQVSTLRSNRANIAVVENISIEAYGSQSPLSQVASLSTPEASQILIEPWDKTIVKDIEKSLTAANLGVSIKNEGQSIRLAFPPLTEESKKEIIKVLGTKTEQARVSLRGIRDKVKDGIVKKEKNHEISEDDKYGQIEDLDAATKQYTEKINSIAKEKEDSLLSV